MHVCMCVCLIIHFWYAHLLYRLILYFEVLKNNESHSILPCLVLVLVLAARWLVVRVAERQADRSR